MMKNITKVDACIIGSGAGGGVVAKELSERGINVVVLEAGKRLDPLRDYTTASADWETSYNKLFRVPNLRKITSKNQSPNRPLEVHGVGGGTLQYLAYAIRLNPDDFRTYSEDGVGADWPITYDDLVPYYRKVEIELGVSGRAGDDWIPRVEYYPNPPFEYSYANKVIQRGCDKLGIRLWPAPVARLSRPFDGRPMCVQCGTCDRGCMSGAKSSIDVTYIRKAEATGKAQVWPETIVTRIKVNAKGKAESVIYFDKNGVEHELKSDIIIVSAGAIQSPRLLLNSKSKMFPDGLSNSSGLVGKFFMQHFGAGASAFFADRVDGFRGFQGGAITEEFPKTESNRSFARGFRIDLTGDTGPVAAAQQLSSLWGQQLKDNMRKNFGHLASMSTLGEQLPDERNYIELDPLVKDDYGMPVPRMNFEWRENEKKMLPTMEKILREIYDAAGALKIVDFSASRPGGSGHNAGTCRMGKDPKKSVLNSFCQSHDIANLFVIDGSCFVTIGIANPSLTIHAIAARASEYIAEQAKKGNL